MFPQLSFIQSLILGVILIILAFLADFYKFPNGDFFGGLLGGLGAGIIFMGFIKRKSNK